MEEVMKLIRKLARRIKLLDVLMLVGFELVSAGAAMILACPIAKYNFWAFIATWITLILIGNAIVNWPVCGKKIKAYYKHITFQELRGWLFALRKVKENILRRGGVDV